MKIDYGSNENPLWPPLKVTKIVSSIEKCHLSGHDAILREKPAVAQLNMNRH